MITVKPFGGLGNRLRVLYSVFALNSVINDQIKIIWDCSPSLNCLFEDLFECPNNCKVRNISQGFFRDVEKFALNRLHFSKLRSLRYDVMIYDLEAKDWVQNNELLVEQCMGKSVFIETCNFFYTPSNKINFLEPKEPIRIKAKSIYQNFNNTFGIHIRRGNHQKAKQFSPGSAFRELIKAMIKTDSSAQFFLTTDSKKLEKDFIDEFKDKIITSGEKELDRNSPEAIKSALVDILCLSKTKKIYGSYGSSFSSVPRLFTDVECENVIAKNI